MRRLATYLATPFPFPHVVTIADNASTDGTWATAQRLGAEIPHVRAVRLAQKGRGRALRTVWQQSRAAVVAYMDIDLSTDLAALLPLVAPLVSGHSDMAIGSRLTRSSRVVRGARREVLSRGYNLLLYATLRRCPVRLQGDADRLRPPPPALGRGHGLVLRHRAAAAGRALRPPHPRGARRLGRRPGLPRPPDLHGAGRAARHGSDAWGTVQRQPAGGGATRPVRTGPARQFRARGNRPG